MNSDELSRGMTNHYTRKPMPSKYNDNKNHNSYGPGQNYNYGNQSYNGNSHYNGGGNSYNNNHNGQQNQRRRPDRFKRDNYSHNDRLIKQNDIIIRLLKEIRDRLPAPAVVDAEYFEDDQDQDQRIDSVECSSDDQEISEEEMEIMEPVNEHYGSEQDDGYSEEERQ